MCENDSFFRTAATNAWFVDVTIANGVQLTPYQYSVVVRVFRLIATSTTAAAIPRC